MPRLALGAVYDINFYWKVSLKNKSTKEVDAF